MRPASYIIDHFSHKKLLEYAKILASSQYTNDEKLSLALEILHIDEAKFKKAPFKEDKEQFLDYKYYLTIYFELYANNFPNSYSRELSMFKFVAKLAFNIIKEHPIITEHQDRFCKYAKGLSHLYLRSGHISKQNIESDNKQNIESGLLASMMVVGDKTGGIEPGFMAVAHQDVVTYLIQTYPNEEDCLTFIKSYAGNIDAIYNAIKNKLAEHMYKFDYKTKDWYLPQKPGGTSVFLEARDAQRTNTVRECYKGYGRLAGDALTAFYVANKKSTALKINTDAIIETLSNDLASIYMQAQNQKLFLTTHTNGALKFMASSEMVKDAKSFGDLLTGDNTKKKGYRGQKLIMPIGNIRSITDTSIPHLSRLLYPFLFTGDHDKIGSEGQNLLIVPLYKDEKTGVQIWMVVGIDYGHTLQKRNPVLLTMYPDGRYTLGTFDLPFKNYSALTDAPLSERMQGALILARLQGQQINDDIILSHGQEFYELYHRIPSGTALELCDNYLTMLNDFKEWDFNSSKEYDLYTQEVSDFKQRLKTDLSVCLDKLKNYYVHDAKAIDLADNLNKLCAAANGKTSLLSENGQHLLNHMRIYSSYPKTWSISKENNIYKLSCAFDDNIQKMDGLLKKVTRFSDNVTVAIENKQLVVKFHQLHLQEMVELFNEPMIMQTFHPKEAHVQQQARLEVQLRTLIEAPWFSNNNVATTLMISPKDNSQYRLLIYTKPPENIASDLAQLIGDELGRPWDGKEPFMIDFLPDNLKSFIDRFTNVREIHGSKQAETKKIEVSEQLERTYQVYAQKVAASLAQEEQKTTTTTTTTTVRSDEEIREEIKSIIEKVQEERRMHYKSSIGKTFFRMEPEKKEDASSDLQNINLNINLI